jgi:hypothetical protein
VTFTLSAIDWAAATLIAKNRDERPRLARMRSSDRHLSRPVKSHLLMIELFKFCGRRIPPQLEPVVPYRNEFYTSHI